jgi:hypothetical protein
MKAPVIILTALLVAWPCVSSGADKSRVVIHAVVLAVDPGKSIVVLHHEALETGTATDRVCRLRHHRDALILARGTVIEATAETAHQPWVLDNVQVRARTLMPGPSSAAI